MLLSCSVFLEVDLFYKFAFAYFLATKTLGQKALFKKFHIHFSSIFVQMFGCCVRLNVCSTKIIIKKKHERCGSETCKEQPGMP